MSSESLNYPRMLQTALRGLVREALVEVEEEGMPGEHHFYIQFSTRYPGLIIPTFLLEQFPEEMTIILQHQFWDLVVEEDEFSVTLSFGGSRHPLTVPFDAVTSFADPSARFALAIEEPDRGGDDGPEEAAEDPAPDDSDDAGPRAKVVELDAFRKPRG